MKFDRTAVAVSAALAIGFSLTGIARADVKIVQKVTVTGIPKDTLPEGQPDPSKPQTVTTYLKGDKVRLENGQSILILDGEKVYALDTVAKAYTILDLKDIATLNGSPAAAAMLTFDSTADVKDTGEAKPLAGKASHKYTFTATIKLGLSGANAGMSALLPTVKLEGEQWASDAIPVPAGYTRLSAAVGIGAMRRMLGKGLDPLVDKLGTIKGIPLASREVTTFTFADPNSPFAAQAPKGPLVKTTEVTSVSEDALAEGLFVPPADYKKMDRPSAPPTAAPGGPARPTTPAAPTPVTPAPTTPAPAPKQ